MQKMNSEACLKKKGTKREYGRNRCRNMTKNKKNKLKVYQTKYKVAKK